MSDISLIFWLIQALTLLGINLMSISIIKDWRSVKNESNISRH